MSGTLPRRFGVLLGAAAAAWFCWKHLPGSETDRVAFTTTARSFANPPFFVSGNGSHATPWNLRTFASKKDLDTREAPVIVSLDDDLEGFFQSSPPSPIDLAVIFSNFQRLGAKKAATSAVLAWESPDPIGLAALDKTIGKFDSLIMAAPLSRGAVAEPMPPAFRHASIPLSSIPGDSTALPVVNRVSLGNIILGKENTSAGFQILDSEKPAPLIPLMARWDDRVVFAFSLLVVMQRFDLPLDGMEIRLGKYLRLGPDGPIVAIDRFGRLALTPKPVSPYAVIPAETLIDGGEELFPKSAPEPVILRDDRSSAEPAVRGFSAQLPTVIAAIASDTGIAPFQSFPRLEPKLELIGLAAIVILLVAVCALTAFARNILLLGIAAACLTAQTIVAASAMLWLPGLPALAAILCAAFVSSIIALREVRPRILKYVIVPTRPKPKKVWPVDPPGMVRPAEAEPEPTPEPPPEPEPTPEPPPEPKPPPAKKVRRSRKKRRR